MTKLGDLSKFKSLGDLSKFKSLGDLSKFKSSFDLSKLNDSFKFNLSNDDLEFIGSRKIDFQETLAELTKDREEERERKDTEEKEFRNSVVNWTIEDKEFRIAVIDEINRLKNPKKTIATIVFNFFVYVFATFGFLGGAIIPILNFFKITAFSELIDVLQKMF